MYYNESSYYRANPFYRQGYIPDRGFVNRRAQENLVEIPQGDSHFDPTRRKHFGTSDTSQIQETHLFSQPDELSKPTIAIHKEFQRNLETKDIEGAVTNTLISPVIRNRLRSQELKKMYEYNQQAAQDPNNQGQMSARQQKVAKMYKQQANVINNGPISTPSSTSNKRNYHIRDFPGPEKYQRREIYQAPEPHTFQPQQAESQNQRQPYQQMHSLDAEPKYNQPEVQYHQSHQKYNERQSTEQKPMTDRERRAQFETLQAKIDEQRRKGEEQKQEYRTIEQPTPVVAARRINPTYLSYGSNPFNLAAQNIIRQ